MGHVRDLPAAPVTIRRAGPADREAARALHARCSRESLGERYHGPVRDADRYLDHLLDPRFGQTLAAEAGGRLVALGHLLPDEDGAELAVLVEDAWQGRGLGRELVRRLAELARGAGFDEVYALTRPSNAAMTAVLRGLGVPLEYRVESGTLTVSVCLAGAPAALSA